MKLLLLFLFQIYTFCDCLHITGIFLIYHRHYSVVICLLLLLLFYIKMSLVGRKICKLHPVTLLVQKNSARNNNTKKEEVIFLNIPYLFQYQHLIGFGQNPEGKLHTKKLLRQLHQRPGLPRTTSRTET